MSVVKTKWEDDEFLIDEEIDETEELDEDELYVKETETSLVESDDDESFHEYDESVDEEYE